VNARNRDGHPDIVSLLCESGADVDAPSEVDGSSALLQAAAGNWTDGVNVLLYYGADINFKTTKGQTPLMGAAYYGAPSTAELLLLRGADPDLHDNIGGKTALIWAIVNGHSKVAQVIIDGGADPNAADDDGATPVMWAIVQGDEATVQALLKAGARQ
jgi:ankyrin repeat protein